MVKGPSVSQFGKKKKTLFFLPSTAPNKDSNHGVSISGTNILRRASCVWADSDATDSVKYESCASRCDLRNDAYT